jgi:environmental stress-induced protein Ves
VADIVEEADFSTFEGADRHFLLVSSGFLVLDVEGSRRDVIQGRPETFTGEDLVRVKEISEPVSVINLIAKRSVCSSRLDVRHLDGPTTLDPTTVAMVLHTGAAQTRDGRNLEPMEFLVQGQEPETLHFDSAVATTIHAWPHSSL